MLDLTTAITRQQVSDTICEEDSENLNGSPTIFSLMFKMAHLEMQMQDKVC